jgi:16S rRNA (cytidine1402-2'-O)-methyltransferase
MKDKGKLYLIPNVLAPGTINAVLPCNIKDIANSIEYYFAEDIRTARRFLSELKLISPIEDLKFFKLNKDTSPQEVKAYFKEVPEGKNIGILSEAGCPCIADPGSWAVSIAHEMGIEVIPIVGPSSILMALMASGFNGQSFVFHGYLPIDKEDRTKAIKSIEKDSRYKDQTQIFMETPYRNNKLLEDLIKTCGPETMLAIAANLTAENQFIRSQKIKWWKSSLPDLDKQPAIFLLLSK